MLLRKTLSLAAVAAFVVPAAAWASEEGVIDLGAPVAAQALDQNRGRQDSIFELNWQETNAEMKDAIAAHNRTGHNIIGGGSFKDAVGFPMTIQNTGNNVIMQNAVIISIDLHK
jgi:hypothetical protein